MQIKSIVGFFAVSVFVGFANAQSASQGSLRATVPTPPKQGFGVAATYTNLADFTMKVSASGFGFKDTINGSTHLGMAGARLFFASKLNSTVGFEPGLSVQKRMNTNEFEDHLQLVTIDSNFIFQNSNGIGAYVGPSLSKFDQWYGVSSLPTLGAQFGLGYKAGALNLKAGYSHHGFNLSNEGVSYEGHLGGFNAQVGYVF